jgi:predicted ABC-class ATPase
VIAMDSYTPHDVTSQARAIATKYKAERRPEGGPTFGQTTPRIPVAESFDPSRGRKAVKIDVKDLRTLVFGRSTIDLSALEQLVDRSQTRAIGECLLKTSGQHMNGHKSLNQVADQLMEDFTTQGLETLNSKPMGNYALPRRFEIAAAINRLRTLKIKPREH